MTLLNIEGIGEEVIFSVLAVAIALTLLGYYIMARFASLIK